MGKRVIICIIGRSGCGKDTVVSGACAETGWRSVLSYTTRPRREGEGETHRFVEKQEFDRLKKRCVAYTQIGFYEYMVTEGELADADFYIIDPPGYEMLSQNERLCKRYRFVPVRIWLTDEEQMERLCARGDDPAAVEERVRAEGERFRRFEKWAEAEGIAEIHNDGELSESVAKLIKIVKAEGKKTRRTKEEE